MLAEATFVAGVAIWVWFVPRALRNLARLATAPAAASRPTGVILLTTVATQAIALLALRLFADLAAVRAVALSLLGVGAACYVTGAAVILRRYVRGPDWRLATDWDNTNCILHGALSITGLTATVSGAFGISVLAAFWDLTLAVFVAVEAIEIARLIMRVRDFGWCNGVMIYDVSQWARNFTFGMFYAFTLVLARSEGVATESHGLDDLIGAVAGFGQYVVLLLLVAELALMGLWLGQRAGRLRTAASFHRGG